MGGMYMWRVDAEDRARERIDTYFPQAPAVRAVWHQPTSHQSLFAAAAVAPWPIIICVLPYESIDAFQAAKSANRAASLPHATEQAEEG